MAHSWQLRGCIKVGRMEKRTGTLLWFPTSEVAYALFSISPLPSPMSHTESVTEVCLRSGGLDTEAVTGILV